MAEKGVSVRRTMLPPSLPRYTPEMHYANHSRSAKAPQNRY